MTLYHRRPLRATQPEELRFLSTFAGTVSIAIDNARLYGEQARLAITDGLTGLYNHQHFHEALAAEVNRARRYGHPISAHPRRHRPLQATTTPGPPGR